jgi:hypothetical protein
MASIMNSVPAEHRGAASGMRATIQNSASTISQAIFFTIIIVSLSATLPGALSSAVTNAGAPQLASVLSATPASAALFASFLGYNPVATLLHTIPASLASTIPQQTTAYLTGSSFFPNAISAPFMTALREAFVIGAVMCIVAAICSVLRGSKYVAGQQTKDEKKA